MINENKCKEINKHGTITTVRDTCVFYFNLLQIVASAFATHTVYREATSCSDEIFELALNFGEWNVALITL